MYTTEQKSNNECSHNEFYGQFVTEGMKNHVSDVIGKQRILSCKDAHFNTIALRKWDSMVVYTYIDRQLMKDSGLGWSISTNVCIAKAAARAIQNER